jgi:hypothetical protein
MPFLNLRSHKKLLIVDGSLGFTGGVNISDGNRLASKPSFPIRDTHFRIEGPVVEQLAQAFAADWSFVAEEDLEGDVWFPPLHAVGDVTARVVTSGPDADIEKIATVILQAVSCARRSIRLTTPYFLPNELITNALCLAAARSLLRGGREMHHDRAVIGKAARQNRAPVADEASHEAAVEPQRRDPSHGVRRPARADVAEARKQGRPDDVVVAEHGGAVRQVLFEPAQLAPVQHLAVREMHVGDAERAEIEHLADPVDDDARGQRHDFGRRLPWLSAPDGRPMDAPRQRRAREVSADAVRDRGDAFRRLLHEHEIGLLALDESDDALHRRAGPAQQVPAHDLAQAGGRLRLRFGVARRGGLARAGATNHERRFRSAMSFERQRDRVVGRTIYRERLFRKASMPSSAERASMFSVMTRPAWA